MTSPYDDYVKHTSLKTPRLAHSPRNLTLKEQTLYRPHVSLCRATGSTRVQTEDINLRYRKKTQPWSPHGGSNSVLSEPSAHGVGTEQHRVTATSLTPTDKVLGISWLRSWVQPATGEDAIYLQFSGHPSHSPVTKPIQLSRISFRYYFLPTMHKQIVWQFYFGTELEDPHMHQHLNGRCNSQKLSAQNSLLAGKYSQCNKQHGKPPQENTNSVSPANMIVQHILETA